MESSPNLDTQWLGRLLKKDHKDNEPADIVDFHLESAVPKGENYTSVVTRVKMNLLTESGSRKSSSLIVKTAKVAETAKVLEGFSAFRIETKMFTTIIRQMKDLMDEFDDKRETLWPKLYGYKPYSCIVLEDLKEDNFFCIDRKQWQDLDHGLLALRGIGRFHAMTKVLMSRGLISNDDKGHYFAGPKNPVKDALFNGGLHMLSKVMINHRGSWPAGWEDIGNKIKKQIGVLPLTMETLYTEYDRKFEVLNHGDMWSSNMMFKNMEFTNKPIAVKFVDYQLLHLSSFIWDVVYLLYTSVRPSIRRSNLDLMLEAYHESLAHNLTFFGWEDYIPTVEDVKSEAKRLRPAAFAFVTTVMPITSANTNDAFIMENLLTHPPDECFNENVFSDEKFVKEVGDDLKEFANLGVI